MRSGNIYCKGKIRSKYKVYVGIDPAQTLIARKGNQYMEAGYVYAPYVPVIFTPFESSSGMEPFYQGKYKRPELSPSGSLQSRYGTRIVDRKFYGKIDILPSESLSLEKLTEVYKAILNR